MRSLPPWLLPACVAASLAGIGACGGRVVVDVTGNGGASSSASTASTGPGPSTTVASSSSTGAGGGCPAAPFPSVEGACTQEGLACPVPNACCGGQAVCMGGFWTYQATPPCNMPCSPDCGPGGFACAGGKVCVTFLGKTTTYQCADPPCQGPLTCGCAAPLCMIEGLVCNNIQDGFKVLCDCNGPCN